MLSDEKILAIRDGTKINPKEDWAVTFARAIEAERLPQIDGLEEALESANHAVSYAATMDLDDDDYVEICPIILREWKAIYAAATAYLKASKGE